MKPVNNLVPAGIVLFGAYILYSQPFGKTLATFGVAAIVYALTKSQEVVLFLFVASLFLNGFNALFAPRRPEPVGLEAFQLKDPVSTQKRLEQVRQPAPLAPKVESVTGVLESASILDTQPLQGYESLAKEALPGASIPASAKARVAIYTPAEGFVPAAGTSPEKGPKENPFLQNGPDYEGVEVSLVSKGTEMPAPEVGASAIPAVAPSAL
jgi:hypothetical protein